MENRQLPPPVTAVPATRNINYASSRADNPSNASSSTSSPFPVSNATLNANHQHALPIDMEEVKRLLGMHKCFQMESLAPGVKAEDLANLEDLTPYKIEKSLQDSLWAEEANRLVAAVDPTKPLKLFTGTPELASDSRKSYALISQLADQAWHVMNILVHDAENMMVEHVKELCNSDDLERGRRVIDFFLERNDDATTPEMSVQAKQADFFELVNYCTGVMARVVCSAVDGQYIRHAFIAHLARIATKIKILSAKPFENSEISLAYAADNNNLDLPQVPVNWARAEHGASDPQTELHALDTMLQNLRMSGNGELSELQTSSKKDALKSLYFLQCSLFRHTICDMLKIILLSLRGSNNLMRTSVTSYDLCALVYETGFERFRTLVYQDQDNDLSGTSDASNINCARSAFYLLDETINRIDAVHKRTAQSSIRFDTTRDNSVSVGTRILWSFASERDGFNISVPNRLRLSSMGDVVNVMIPLLMANPACINNLAQFITVSSFTIASSERTKNHVKPRTYDKYSAYFSLNTSEYSEAQNMLGPKGAKALSGAFMGRDALHAGETITKIGRAGTFRSVISSSEGDRNSGKTSLDRIQQIQKHQAELDKIDHKMREWIYVEKGVMVRCKIYVWSILTLCLALASGGIAIGLTIGERITGVDPFNFSTYCWVLAGFIILVAKSIRVQEWPWNDFLHGRVLCRSLTELSSVTRLNEQLILVRLLQDESVSILQTRGPYNTVFNNRQSSDGFSIDQPLELWTMLISGLIMVQVETMKGQALVCLDLRRGTEWRFIGGSRGLKTRTSDDMIICTQLYDSNDQEPNGGTNDVRLSKGQLTWVRVIGFFGNTDAKFV